MKLVIVESPSKSGTVQKYLPSDFKVKASLGHIRDLADEEDLPDKYQDKDWAYLGVDVENDFDPFYVVDSEDTITTLKEEVEKADELYLATDEDREGEAISWHLKEVLDPSIPVHRMTFNEITKSTVQNALQNTRDIDENLVHAQEARRILDRLIGYPLSSLIDRIKFGISTGRVQSVAVRLLADKELDRSEFTEHEYWDLSALFDSSGEEIEATSREIDGNRVAESKDFDSQTGEYKNRASTVWLKEDDAKELQKHLEDEEWEVESVEEKPYTSSPPPPFITSTLQRKASYKLGMSASYTMSVAQDLYENGYITYMRTDNVGLSKEARKAARREGYNQFGDEYVHDSPRFYSSSSSAQGAHEAIRPSGSNFTHPNKAGLSGKQYKLYRMIWQRTVASQMADAEKTTIKSRLKSSYNGKDVVFESKGTRVDFAGYIASYYMGKNNPEKLLNEKNSIPDWSEGDVLESEAVNTNKHETRPPSRYTEPSLIKELEKKEIGRPSTYAGIMRKISQDKNFAKKDGKTMRPTFTGLAVTEFLKDYFPELVDTSFTADMESSLDKIAGGEEDKTDYLRNFYSEFKDKLHEAREKSDDSVKELDLPHLSEKVKIGYYGAYVEFEKNGETQTVSLPDDLAPDELTSEKIEELWEEKNKKDAVAQDPSTGEHIYLKEGKYGEYLQYGEFDSEENDDPETSDIPDSVDAENIDPQLAIRLFELPRKLGEYEDKDVEAGLGPYGPYVRYGKDGDYEYESLDSLDRVFEITRDEAVEKLREGIFQEFEHPETGDEIVVLDGKYGPYIKYDGENINLPKRENPEEVGEDRIVEIIEEA